MVWDCLQGVCKHWGFLYILHTPCTPPETNAFPAFLRLRNCCDSGESQGLLSVGPITADTVSGSQFLKTRQTYSFSAVCRDEVTTRMSCGIELQGLNADGEWIEIEDVPTLNEYLVQFLDNLNL